MKTCLEPYRRPHNISSPRLFAELARKNESAERNILISEDTLFSSGGSRGIVGIGKGFFVI